MAPELDQTAIIGMLHLPPLPGSPRFGGDLQAVRTHVMADAEKLLGGGIGQLMLENFADAPFYPHSVPSHTVAHMTAIAAEVKRRFAVPLGINVLRNDGCAALSIAHAVGADFIRVNVLCGARVTDQGIVQGIAHDLLRLRETLGASHIRILADVAVKHSAPLADLPIAQEVSDLVHRGLADALIVTGTGTGQLADFDQFADVKQAAGDTPVLVGSGVTADNVASFLTQADGLIVGSSLKQDGDVSKPVDPSRVAALMQAIAGWRSAKPGG